MTAHHSSLEWNNPTCHAQRMWRKALVVVVGLSALVLSPAGCGLFGPTFNYGAKEMRAAVEGTWVLESAELPSGTLTFEVRQAAEARRSVPGGLVRSAMACSSRTLVRNAHACADVTRMPLEVKVANGMLGVSGAEFIAGGGDFDGGTLSIPLGEDHLSATINPHGVTTLVTVNGSSGKLRRTAR